MRQVQEIQIGAEMLSRSIEDSLPVMNADYSS